MKLWTDFYDNYLRDLRGCTSFAAANELRRATQEFCDRTKVWRVSLDATTTNAKEDTYDFEIEEEMLLVKVMSAKLDEQDLKILLPDDDIRTGGALLVLDHTQFLLTTQPAARQKVYIKAIMKPSELATGVEDYIYDQYAEKIAYGAKARLQSLADRPYSHPALAQENQERFETAIANVIMRTAKANSSAPLRTKANFM